MSSFELSYSSSVFDIDPRRHCISVILVWMYTLSLILHVYACMYVCMYVATMFLSFVSSIIRYISSYILRGEESTRNISIGVKEERGPLLRQDASRRLVAVVVIVVTVAVNHRVRISRFLQ